MILTELQLGLNALTNNKTWQGGPTFLDKPQTYIKIIQPGTAERAGFEPAVEVLPLQSLSRRPPSANSATSPAFFSQWTPRKNFGQNWLQCTEVNLF